MAGADGSSGVVYFPDSSGRIDTIDLKTGSVLPQVQFSYRPLDNVTADDDALYYTASGGLVVAASRQTGQVLWTYQMVDTAWTSPTVYRDSVFALSADKKIYALDKHTGKLLWKYTSGDRFAHQTAAIAEDTLYAKNEDEALMAVDVATGTLKWSYPLDAYAYTSPAVCGSKIVIEDIWSVKAIDRVSGKLAWEFDPRTDAGFGVQFYYGAPACSADIVFANALHNTSTASSGKSHVFAINVNTGELVWKKELPGHLESSPVVAGGVLYIGCDDNKIHALDVRNGAELWSFETDYYVRTFPVVTNGTLLVASSDQKLYAFRLP